MVLEIEPTPTELSPLSGLWNGVSPFPTELSPLSGGLQSVRTAGLGREMQAYGCFRTPLGVRASNPAGCQKGCDDFLQIILLET